MAAIQRPKFLSNGTSIGFFSVFMALRQDNEETLSAKSMGKNLIRVLSISKKFYHHGIIRNSSVLHFGFFNPESEEVNFLVEIYVKKSKCIQFFLVEYQHDPQLSRFIKFARFYGIESKNVPLPRFRKAFVCAANDYIDPVYFRFHHKIKKSQMVAYACADGYDSAFVPVFPEIYQNRDLESPSFYSHVYTSFPQADGETYVYLPQLFLKPRFAACRNASYKVLISDSDEYDPSKMRTIFSFDQDLNAQHDVQNVFAGQFFADIDECEGLSFSNKATYHDPKTRKQYRHAFKLSDKQVRVLITVKCDGNGTNLVDRCIQTARLYASILGELPDIKRFDVVVMINMCQNLYLEPIPVETFSFYETIGSNMSSKSLSKTVYSTEYLSKCRGDLRWFTDLCTPHAACQPFAIDYHPLSRCLWIVEMNPNV